MAVAGVAVALGTMVAVALGAMVAVALGAVVGLAVTQGPSMTRRSLYCGSSDRLIVTDRSPPARLSQIVIVSSDPPPPPPPPEGAVAVGVTVGLGVGVQVGTCCVQSAAPEPKAPSDHWANTSISAYGPSMAKVYCSVSECCSVPPARRRRVIWDATVAPGRCSRDIVKARRVGLKNVQPTVTAPMVGVWVAVCARAGVTPMVVRHNKPSTMLARAARNCIMSGPSVSCGGGRIGGRRHDRMAATPL
jgi:hypothetical protein